MNDVKCSCAQGQRCCMCDDKTAKWWRDYREGRLK